jgi:hypothetical protein
MRRWLMKIHALMEKHPSVPIEKNGIAKNWHADSFLGMTMNVKSGSISKSASHAQWVAT